MARLSYATSGISRVAYQFPSFSGLPIRHAMSGRVVGAPLEGTTGHGRDTDSAPIEQNRLAFMIAGQMSVADLTVARQTHSTTVRLAAAGDRGRGLFPAFDGFPATDGMVTNDPSVALGVIVADCVPLLLYDRRRHALAVVHAGWRGTVGQIGQQALERMRQTFGTSAVDIVCGIGPSIGPCCYEVGDEVIARWSENSGRNGHRAVVRRSAAYHFDLWNANRLTLIDAGVPRQQIEISGVCVRCEVSRFFSYRAAQQGFATPGRMMMVAQLDARE